MFTPHANDTGAVLPWEYMPAAAGTYKAGQLVQMNGGKITAISAALKTTPPYLCMADITVEDGGIVPVTRVQKNAIYKTQLGAEAAAAVPGTMLEVSAGGLVADAAAAGTFEITYLEGTAKGDNVFGRFQN